MAEEKKNNTPNSVTNIHIHGDVKDSNLAVGKDIEINNQPKESKNKEVFFDAGRRLRHVREEIGLKSSEFVELLGLQSEKKYLSMEQQAEEVPLSLLEKLHEITGVSLEWLKHEKTPRYAITSLCFNPIEVGLQQCVDLNPLDYFFTLETKSLHVGLIAQTGTYRYQVFETGVTLDFWNWIDAHWTIPAFYRFLKALSDHWPRDIRGVVINASDDQKLYNGNVHFMATSWKINLNIVYDILDIEETRLGVSSYSRMYGGNWMSKVHKVFREHLKAE
jgi:transcriptional regulator with XRE-family HTH domain